MLHELFECAARTWPEAAAIDIPPSLTRPERRTLTYAELAQEVEALRAQLPPSVSGECIVAILLGRDTERLYVSQLAVLSAGAAYVCIDPSFPDEQVREILRDSSAVLLLTNTHGQARAERGAFPTKVFDISQNVAPSLSSPRWAGVRGEDALAYVIYTSGTTGKPKGVLIEHQSIVNLVQSDLVEFGLGPGDRVAQGSSPAYDSSVEEIWLALASGATVVALDDDAARLGPDLVGWLQRERITVLCPPPTLLRTTGCENPEESLPLLKLLYVGGEALPRDIADRWARGRRLVNGYGPTECTVTALRGEILAGEPITIGTPVPGLQAWVLDSALNEVIDGVSGELCLGGIGLARGYHARPELTAEKFFSHPTLGRLYRTGDLVHRDPESGAFHYHGRLDSQVKLRGYRIELEAIETYLAQCEGVREAACCVQNEGNDLVAFIVPTDATQPPDFDKLKAVLREALPSYMIPALFGVLTELPKSVGGKLKRESLPTLRRVVPRLEREMVAPRTLLEKSLLATFQETLLLSEALSLDEDFFLDLGGTSLQAAQLISRLRTDAATASLTVRDLYEARTVAALAQRVSQVALPSSGYGSQQTQQQAYLPLDTDGERHTGVLQSLWLLLELTLASFVAYGGFFKLLPTLLSRLGLMTVILITPLLLFLGLALYTPLAVFFAVLVKRLLIGKYTPRREPVWGDFYLRHWIVVQTARLIPWPVLVGTEFQCMALRALGSRIGQRVHLHRGVDLTQGGWDLLDIGDDVTVSQDASLRLVELENRQLVIGPISLGTGATLDVRAGVAPGGSLEAGASLAALSSLPAGKTIPAGEHWDGIPATPAGHAPPVPNITQTKPILSPLAYSLALLLAQSALWAMLALPLELLTLGAVVWVGQESGLVAYLLVLTLALPLTLLLEALAVRALGHVSEGVLSRWSLAYIPLWLKAGLVDSANEWLSGALFWPLWLRAAGMRVGRSCEISTIIDVIPELIEIGPETFFADGIYLGGPRVHRGTVTLSKVTIGTNVFLGNHVVVAGGQHLPDDILLGVCTVADDMYMASGTSWFGHPPFALPHREIVAYDRELTHNPSLLRYLNRLFWEILRFTLPVLPVLVVAESLRKLRDHAWAAPLLAFAGAAVLCLAILALKWLLLGRARPGTHALWSCWCSRWDFLYVAWGVYARGTLTALEGTPMLTWYLRAMGLTLGRGVVLGSGFSQVVDPDMIEIGDGATVTAAFQAHTFEDRVLKLAKVRIGANATVANNTVPLYGAVIGEGTYIAPHSVIMKDEFLLPNQRYEGAPTR
ncbi:MAG: amino acid adenylation domain-containing protein [Armatimonadetes bacterium]|nr:amino acid adenylation domain-containing protein [Armatimonadota bacterium]